MPNGQASRSTGAPEVGGNDAARFFELHAHERLVLLWRQPPLFLSEIGMPVAVRLYVEQPAGAQLGQLFPSEGIGSVGDGGRIDEQGDWNEPAPHQRQHVGVDGAVAVVHRDSERSGWQRDRLAAQAGHRLAQRHHRVAMAGQVVELRREAIGTHRHAVRGGSRKAVVNQDRQPAVRPGAAGPAKQQHGQQGAASERGGWPARRVHQPTSLAHGFKKWL